MVASNDDLPNDQSKFAKFKFQYYDASDATWKYSDDIKVSCKSTRLVMNKKNTYNPVYAVPIVLSLAISISISPNKSFETERVGGGRLAPATLQCDRCGLPVSHRSPLGPDDPARNG